jgi:tetratricopeptide (TPR) repeat protein
VRDLKPVLLSAAGQDNLVIKRRSKLISAKMQKKFVGRAREISTLREIYEQVRSGHGQLVEVVGEAGVGKSRLIFEFKHSLSKAEYTYLEGSCVQYGKIMGYLPIMEVLRDIFDIQDGDQRAKIRSKLKAKVAKLNGMLKTNLPFLEEFLTFKGADTDYSKMENRFKKERAFGAFCDLLIQMGRDKAMILVFEDVHWIDKTSEEFLDFLIGRLGNSQILLILAYRPPYSPLWEKAVTRTRILLAPLTTRASSELVRSTIQVHDLVPELEKAIIKTSNGNPLFIQELTLSLLESGYIRGTRNHSGPVGKSFDIRVPNTVQEIIESRINRAEDTLKGIMQIISAMGGGFAFRILRRLLAMKDEIQSQLLNFEQMAYLNEKRFYPELEYIFKHALIQEVAYSGVAQEKRREIHGKIGKAIEALYEDNLYDYYELLAYHYSRSDYNDKALEYLHLANQKMAGLSAMEEARAYFNKAMELLDTLPQDPQYNQHRVSLLANQLMTFGRLFMLRDFYDLLQRYERMALQIGDPRWMGIYYRSKGYCEMSFGRFDQSIETLTKAAEFSKDAGETVGVLGTTTFLAWGYFQRGEYEQVLRLKDEALRKLNKTFDLNWYASIHCVTSWTYSCFGQWNSALIDGKKALNKAREYENLDWISFACWIISIAHVKRGDFSSAIELAELAVSKAPTHASKAWAERQLGWALCSAGDIDRGVEMLEGLSDVYQHGRYVPFELHRRLYLSEGYLLGGQKAKARRALEDLLMFAEPLGALFHIGYANRLLGEISVDDSPEEASRYFEKSIDIFKALKAENEVALAYAGYGRLKKQQGNISQALDYLMNALEIFEHLGTRIEPDKVRAELAEIAHG